MVSGWTIFFGLLGAYMLLIVWLVRSGKMEKWNLSLLLGFILMIRTQRGRGTLAWLARPTRFWNVFADLGIWVTFLGMAGLTILMLSLVPAVLNPATGIEPLGASEILVIPGVNPFVPLWYGIAALIITLVVHEGGHGILALANKMRVKSVGLLYAIVPVGAFVEPDEDDLMESPRKNRLRVYAAGAWINMVTAGIFLTIFAVMILVALPIAGAGLAGVIADTPAAAGGLEPGDILVGADATVIADWDGLTDFLAERSPGDEVVFDRHEAAATTVTLGSRWDALTPTQQQHVMDETPTGNAYCDARVGGGRYGGECAEQLTKQAFLGVSPAPDVHGTLAYPFGNGGTNFLLHLGLPLGEVRGAPWLSQYMPTFLEAPWSEDVYWPTATMMYWIFWLNLMVGLTNILPMLPLDGGHMFRDGVAGLFERFKPSMDVERRDRVVGRLAGAASLIILAAFLLQIFGPRIARAFA